MTIDEMKARRKLAEEAIREAIVSFERDTGVKGTIRQDVDTYDTCDGREFRSTTITIEVRL